MSKADLLRESLMIFITFMIRAKTNILHIWIFVIYVFVRLQMSIRISICVIDNHCCIMWGCQVTAWIASDASSSSTSSLIPFKKTCRSYVWKYSRGEKCSAHCLLCNKAFVYNGWTTSNLISHWQWKHPSSSREAKQESSQLLQQEIGAFAKAQQCNNKPCSHNVEREITRILSRWPWLDIRQIAIVRDKGLKELLNFSEPNYQLPPTKHVSVLIRKDFNDGKATLSAWLRIANSIAVITDVWTSKATQAFATTTGHFVDDDWKLISCVLDRDNPLPWHHTGVQISEQNKGSLTSYGI